MKILFTGGGGGHFYPIIAVAQAINTLAQKEKLLQPQLFFMAPEPYDEELLFENGIEFIQVPAGKLRRYFSLKYIPDTFKLVMGLIKGFIALYRLYPDVVYSKGSFASFPPLVAARLLGIPVIIHESDSVPGKVNAWSSRFAKKIAISFAEASEHFPEEKIALTGNPIRKELLIPQKTGAHEFLNLSPTIPTIMIIGGSQGAKRINQTVFRALPKLLNDYQVIHQVGTKNLKEAKQITDISLENHSYKERYKLFDHLNTLAIRMAAGVSSLIISRAGSSIFEIAGWGIPSILIPITESNGNHQRKNAFNYARTGAAIVIEEQNLRASVLTLEIEKIMNDTALQKDMAEKAKSFAKPDAAYKNAQEVIHLALEHEG